MTDTGFKLATSGADEAYSGSTIAWSNPSNVTASDDTRSIAALSPTGSKSDYLKASGFDFSAVPAGSTILGVEARVEKGLGSGSGNCHDERVFIRVGDAGTLSNNKADTTTNWAASDTQITYGGAADLWGLSLTQSDLTNLQVLFAAVSVTNARQARVDAIDVRITYTPPASGTPRSFGAVMG